MVWASSILNWSHLTRLDTCLSMILIWCNSKRVEYFSFVFLPYCRIDLFFNHRNNRLINNNRNNICYSKKNHPRLQNKKIIRVSKKKIIRAYTMMTNNRRTVGRKNLLSVRRFVRWCSCWRTIPA